MTNIIPRKNLNIKNRLMVGGRFPEDTINKIKLTDETIKSYTIESLDTTFSFQFSEKNKNTQDTIPHRYLGKGALTAVYSINLTYQNSLSADRYTIPDSYHDKLILRIYENRNYAGIMKSEVNVGNEDRNDDEQSKFIQKWNRDKTTFPENMIDIFMYGEITLLGDYLGYYTITREYIDCDSVITMPLENKLKFLISFITFLEKLKVKNFIYRDCKIANMGCEIKGDQYIFIILDYDDITLFSQEEFKIFKNKSLMAHHFGTAAPLYVISADDKSYNEKLIHLYGIFSLLIELFNTDLDKFADYCYFNNYFSYYMENMIEIALQNVSRIDKKLDYFQMITTRKSIDRKITPLISYFNKNLTKYIIKPYNKTINDQLLHLLVTMLKSTLHLTFDKANYEYNLPLYKDLTNKILQEVIRLKAVSAPVIVPSVTPAIKLPTVNRRSTIFYTPPEMLEEVVIKQKYLKYKQKYLELKQKNN